MTAEAKTLSTSINRSAEATYAFVSNPEHFSQWAAGLGASLQPTAEKNTWQVTTPEGLAKVRFVEKNQFGVVDHYVSLSTGVEVYVPLRVLANNQGSEVMLTVFRLPGMTDDEFKRDTDAVQKDLHTLKGLLEGGE
ncbi:SRPBCC family protein [Chitinophaga japonensis]|uniref:Polyketide cyclase/dehydrase/lipid transport protein n=1 Tax=Chitinophaga japonensis TaxID=104662 RepID=A0A562T2X9_CHIJA|nr:SRPBCC family protein [Chitinophaga japonensis]TWI87912.1 hypothetical protein LX66_1986 [Chitinophaga japonensis]